MQWKEIKIRIDRRNNKWYGGECRINKDLSISKQMCFRKTEGRRKEMKIEVEERD